MSHTSAPLGLKIGTYIFTCFVCMVIGSEAIIWYMSLTSEIPTEEILRDSNFHIALVVGLLPEILVGIFAGRYLLRGLSVVFNKDHSSQP